MIGLDAFKDHFKDYDGTYTLIGGAACYLHMKEEDLEFRATKDLDLVLCVEAIKTEFVQHFWDFINAGGYQFRKKDTGKAHLYRFDKPTKPGFPYMLELLSRQPDLLDDANLDILHQWLQMKRLLVYPPLSLTKNITNSLWIAVWSWTALPLLVLNV